MSNRRKIRHITNVRLADAGQDQDATFFEQHPNQRGYTRPATPDELKATSFPPGTRVYVHLLGPNTRARAFIPPSPSQERTN